ncbi:MAG: hypothetical protein WEB60_08890 [Terrimicrobiaceae bacterium]
MKSAYELAMSRLEKEKPIAKVSEKTKALLAEIDSEIDAKVAEKKIFLEGEIAKSPGDPETAGELKRQLALEISRLEEKRGEKKDKIRRDTEA